MNLFFVRPATRNIGNDIIGHAAALLLREVFGDDVNIVNVPALQGPQFGGLVSRQVHDMNRLADAVIVGGGNLLENGQLSYDRRAVEALRPPLVLLALSHGRIASRPGGLESRTDSLPAETIRHLAERAELTMVRDDATQAILHDLGVGSVVAGCPTLFLAAAPDPSPGRDVLVSVRHPLRMSVPPPLQWRIPEDLRLLLAALRAETGRPIRLVCHDYIDLEFASGFPEATPLYFDDCERYLAALRNCAVHVSYRLHGFLPCVALGTHSIHLSYDERGRSMLETIGMGTWNIDLLQERDFVSAVIDRARDRTGYESARRAALAPIARFRRITLEGLERLRAATEAAAAAVQG